ncbi:EF-hand domain-containing protein [Lysobacter sp. KIS68-7]|uniref:EF-hand domain-containing protein n=1 Tax=Lysobacter sp. KIS68-7 TaxID=2904252 RepID=UPI001E2DC64D|nr:EF-hand domain-containing protein [Lysobacter sp. KIS68-7]UHQ18190.1 EF-hand domain-containing protein [Lysobacter sp. KIS68-7]
MKIAMLAAALLLLPVATLHAEEGHRGRHHEGLERLDTDQDGRISRAEFDAGRAARDARMAQHPERAEWKRAESNQGWHEPDFAALDANHDGYIVRSELRAYHERMRPLREAERNKRFDERFVAADLNRDGKLGRTEVSEAMPRLSDEFNWLDENRDGFLSRAELKADRDRR